jgi:hypothetical protein
MTHEGQRGYGRLNLQRAMQHPYNAHQVRHISRAIGVDLSDEGMRREHFVERRNATYLSEAGAARLADKQRQWKSADLYEGPIDAIYGSGSRAAYKAETRRDEPLGPGISPVAGERDMPRSSPLGEGISPVADGRDGRTSPLGEGISPVAGSTPRGRAPHVV